MCCGCLFFRRLPLIHIVHSLAVLSSDKMVTLLVCDYVVKSISQMLTKLPTDCYDNIMTFFCYDDMWNLLRVCKINKKQTIDFLAHLHTLTQPVHALKDWVLISHATQLASLELNATPPASILNEFSASFVREIYEHIDKIVRRLITNNNKTLQSIHFDSDIWETLPRKLNIRPIDTRGGVRFAIMERSFDNTFYIRSIIIPLLVECKQLHEVVFDTTLGNTFEFETVMELHRRIPKLSRLEVPNRDYTAEQMIQILSCTTSSLRSLFILGDQVDMLNEANFIAFPQLQHLHHIDMSVDTNREVATLTRLLHVHCTELEQLSLVMSNADDEIVKVASWNMPCLRQLSLDDEIEFYRISERLLSALRADRLERLDMENSVINVQHLINYILTFQKLNHIKVYAISNEYESQVHIHQTCLAASKQKNKDMLNGYDLRLTIPGRPDMVHLTSEFWYNYKSVIVPALFVAFPGVVITLVGHEE